MFLRYRQYEASVKEVDEAKAVEERVKQQGGNAGANKYGEKGFWEKRYKNKVSSSSSSSATSSSVVDHQGFNSIVEVEIYEWYVSYDKLAPLLQPDLLKAFKDAVNDGTFGDAGIVLLGHLYHLYHKHII